MRLVPIWLQWLLGGLASAAVGAATALAVVGVAKRDLVTVDAAAYLLAVVLPVAGIVLLLVFTAGGTKALHARTNRVLKSLLPGELRQTLGAEVHVAAGHFEADYVIEGPAIRMHCELNVRRCNVGVLLCRPPKNDLSHTIKGAAATPSSFSCSGETLPWTIGGVKGQLLVFSKTLSEDFLWDAADQLFFARDVSMLVRAMHAEAPHLFEGVA